MQLAHSTGVDLDQRRGDRVETGNVLESLIRAVPLLVLIGCCAMSR
jgi:hypothetical protein